MPYLNLDPDYFDHPKVIRLIVLLGKGSEVIPIRLWCKAAKYHARDGKLSGYTVEEIEACAGWWGQPGEAAKAMETIGFLNRSRDGSLTIHDWLDHNGHVYALKRRNKIVAVNRWKNARKTQFSVDTSGIPQSTTRVPQSVPILSNPTTKRIRGGFSPPTPAEVSEYATAIGFRLDGGAFVDHYAARGWRYNGNVAMKDWRAAVRTWKKKDPGAVILPTVDRHKCASGCGAEVQADGLKCGPCSEGWK